MGLSEKDTYSRYSLPIFDPCHLLSPMKLVLLRFSGAQYLRLLPTTMPSQDFIVIYYLYPGKITDGQHRINLICPQDEAFPFSIVSLGPYILLLLGEKKVI